MDGSMPRHHAARVEAAIASGQAARSALVASWRRSSRLHHLDPAGRGLPLRLSETELRQARERIAPLLAAAQGAMDRLYQAVGAAGCCVLLADGEGVPVDRRGASADDATFESWGLWTGALWSEEHEGTNGIGTCVVEQRPLTIDRDQHFFTRNTLLSCTAVPIYDHEAAFAGVLDVSSCRADRTDAFSNLIALAARRGRQAYRSRSVSPRLRPCPHRADASTGRPVGWPRRGRRRRSRDRRDPVRARGAWDRAGPGVAAGARGRSARRRQRT